jgi:alpha-tubulin suppressor-like RCC1 family protein
MSISAGHSHNLAIKSDGTLWAWGQNVYGQFGNGTKGVRSNVFAMIDVPVPGAPGKDWKQAVAGGSHSFGIKRDGTLWAWGNNWAGQLGISSTNDSLVPVQIGLSTNWVKVWAGLCNGAGLQSDGSLWFWGDNPALRTQVGRSGRNLLAPQLISPGVRWVDAAFGNMLVLGVTSDGLLLAWGRYAINYSTNSAPADVPVGIGSDSDWAACYSAEWARELYAVLRKKNGTIWIMESSVATGNKVRFTEVMVPKPFVALAAGGGGGLDANGMHDGVCAGVGLSNDGEVWTWGRGLGALGYTRGQPALQFCASLAGRIGVGVHWGYPRPIPSGNEPRVVEVEPER